MSDRQRRVRALVLSALIAGSMIVGGIAFAGAATAQDDDPIVRFADYSEERELRVGDALQEPFVIRLANTETATLSLANENVSFRANVTVRDDDGDGTVNLTIRSFRLGHSDPFVASSGSVVDYEQDSFEEGEIIPKETYDLHLAPGDDAAAAMESTEIAELTIDEAETQEIEPATAPATADFETLSDVYRRADHYSNLAPGLSVEGDAMVADGDTLLAMPWGNGYYGMYSVAMEQSETPEDALLWLLDEGFYEFSFEQQMGDKALDVEYAIEQGELDFHADKPYGHVMFHFGTDAEIFESGGEYVDMEPGETYEASFAKARRADPDPDHSQTVTQNFTVLSRSLTGDTPVATLPDEVGGVTNLAPGTNLTVYLDDGSETHEFSTEVMKRPGAADQHVQSGIEEHPWNVSVDLGDVEETGVTYSVWAEGHGRVGGFPPDAEVGPTTTEGGSNNGDGTTTDPGGEGDGTATGTADPGEDTATGTTDPGTDDTTTDGGDGDDGGNGNTVPGFTAGVALLAVLVAALLAARRGE